MTQRPNILFITSDQQRWDCIGFEHRAVNTPNIDGLAKTGARFSTCITPNVVCQPARASILTGMLPLTHGVADNGIDLPPETAELGFAGQLARSGYRTALLGKGHFSSKSTEQPSGTPECQYSSVDYGEDWFGPYMGFEHVELMIFGHFQRRVPPGHRATIPFEPPYGQHFERWFHSRGTPGEARRLWEDSTDGKGLLAAQTWNSALPEDWHSSTWVGDRTIDYLEKASETDGPFCAWASFPDPHHPFDCPAPWNAMYDPQDVDLPEHRTRDLEVRPWWHQKLYGDEGNIDPNEYTDKRLGGAARMNMQTDEQLRHMTANYYGMMSLLDHHVGRIVGTLKNLGLDKNTIVIYTTDHGELLGDHGLILKGPTLYEGLTKVGLIFNGPGIAQGSIIDEPVSTLDLAATMYDYAGIETPPGAQSRSLKGLVEARGETRDMAYNEWDAGGGRYAVDLNLRLVRTKRYKAIFELESGAGELYDLHDDPNEMVNRYDDPGFKKIKKELEDIMHARPGAILKTPLKRIAIN